MNEYLPHLAAWRVYRGLYQRELAEKSGQSRIDISELERQNRMARQITVARLAKALGIDPDELRHEPPKREK